MKIMKPPSICIIDDSAMTTKIYRYLIQKFFIDPKVTTFNHPWDVNLLELNTCDLIIIDEVMDDITGTEFLAEVLIEQFEGRYHEFPNVIFISSLDSGDLNERIKIKKLDLMIPSFRVMRKPITPITLKNAITSICPNLCDCIIPDASLPNSELPWIISIKKALDEICGVTDTKPTKHCMISL